MDLFNVGKCGGVPSVIATVIEHPCVLQPLQYYANAGVIDLKLCSVNSKGIVDLHAFNTLLNSNTLFVSVMYALITKLDLFSLCMML